MILNLIVFKEKLVKYPVQDEQGNIQYVEEYVPDKKRYSLVKRDFELISDFSEYINDQGIVYKNRCLVKDVTGEWLVVKHSFQELYSMKYKPIKGFMKHLTNYDNDEPFFEKIKKNEKSRVRKNVKGNSKRLRDNDKTS